MRRQKFLRFLGEALVVCLLSLSLPAFAQGVPVHAKEWAAQKEAVQIKLDHLKETQKSDVESLNKRIDDTLTMTGQAVDRFGVITAWIGGLVTALLAGLGLLGFITVTRKTKAEAEDAAQAWFNEKASTLLQEIEQLEQRARDAHTHVAASVKSVDDHASAAKQAMDRQQAAMGQAPDAKTQRSTQNSADAATLQQRDAELQQQPETSYSFDDWNARAHAAYAADKLTDAIYFWERASQVKNAGAANAAQALYNKGVAQSQAGDSAGAIESYNELIRRYGDTPEAELRRQVAIALNNKGVAQGRAGDTAGAIECFTDVIRRYGDAPEVELRGQVATALNNKGVAQGQAGGNAGEIESYTEVIRRYGDAPEAELCEEVARAYNGRGWTHFVEAKRLWKTDRIAAKQYLQQARQQFDLGVNRMLAPEGMILGNRAYARFLQGDTEGAETDFNAGLMAKINGGQSLYDATLKDLDLHPLDEDSGMRTMVDRLWQDYKAAGKA